MGDGAPRRPLLLAHLSIFASHNRSSAGTQFHSAVVITAMNLPSLTPQPVDARAEREHKA
jgi:hypothetical protein